MFRRLFQFSLNGNGWSAPAAHPDHDDSVAQESVHRRPMPVPQPAKCQVMGVYESFDEIYHGAPAISSNRYNILSVASMLKSQHLVGMSGETKRGAIMMAREAAGVEVKDILQDAMLRQRALNDYEESQQKKLREFEAAKTESNRQIQAELDAITAEYMARIQSNIDDVAKQRDAFRAWQKTKQQEAASIGEALTYCSATESAIDNLSVVLEQSTIRR
jgi:hypothetical protein